MLGSDFTAGLNLPLEASLCVLEIDASQLHLYFKACDSCRGRLWRVSDESLLMLEREIGGGFSHGGGCRVPHMSPDGLLSLGITVHDEILKVNVADEIRRF